MKSYRESNRNKTMKYKAINYYSKTDRYRRMFVRRRDDKKISKLEERIFERIKIQEQ